jgi:hypothetical protein
MNQGVQILLERMRSNPDEFIPTVHGYYPKKWQDILLAVQMRAEGGKDYQDQLPFLSDEEIKALWGSMQQLQGELFTKKVMNTLLMDAGELSSSFGEPNDASKNWGTSTITLLNTGAVSGTITGRLRYP